MPRGGGGELKTYAKFFHFMGMGESEKNGDYFPFLTILNFIYGPYNYLELM